MAEILPFHGILYNPEKIRRIADVVTPPYDVISDAERDAFYQRHPHNVIRLDKGRPEPGDTDRNNPHTRAAAYFETWRGEGILVRDPAPCLYLTAVEFPIKDQPVIRFGLIAKVGLEPFENGVILPHETTFSKVKSERLELMKACHANFSQIFSIFSDHHGILGLLKDHAETLAPVFDFHDDAGHRHRLWRITNPDVQRRVSDAFKGEKLFIADGHHRYETALNYRKWLYAKTPDLDPKHPAHFTMMYLCAVQDPGLVILPTHRLLTRVPAALRDGFPEAARAFFDVERHEWNAGDLEKTIALLHPALAARPGEHRFGVFIKTHPEFYILKLRAGVMDRLFGDAIAAPLRELDVIVLTRLIFGKLLELDDAALDDHDRIHFSSREADVVAAVARGSHDMAVILNPTTNDQVTRIAEKGLIMPRKSTYYFPKAISGQVMRSLTPEHP